MPRFNLHLGAVALAALTWFAGCASTSPEPAFRDVAQTVEARLGHRPRWDQNTMEDQEVAAALERLLAAELTADAAVQVALLGNPSLRSTFEELSIAQADLVQAGLLKNPVFGVGAEWEGASRPNLLFFSLEQDFLDLVTMPMRKRVAATQLEATKLRVGAEVLALAAEVRSAFYTAQAAEQIVTMRGLVQEAAEASADLAQRQYEAGTMNDLALSTELGLASQVRLDLKRSEGEAAVAREHLTRLMGLWGTRTGWRLAPRLPELPKEEVSLERLESIAMNKRLDIAAARREVQALDYTLSVARSARWTGFVNIEVEAAKRRGESHLSFGPRASLELPIFDQRQAAIARLEALGRISENNLQALAIEARSDVRASRSRVLTTRAMVEEYGKVLVPIRENIVKFAQQHYDAMLLGVYQLLLAKQSEFATYQEYIEAVRDYWIARSDLERAVGARPGPAARSAAPAASPSPKRQPSAAFPAVLPSSSPSPTHEH